MLTLELSTRNKPKKMTEFDKKLNLALHAYKMETNQKLYKIADDAGINRQALYSFTAGKSSLNSENTKKLMDHLGLTIELEKK